MRCAVCGSEGAKDLLLENGKRAGSSCEGPCSGLLWLGYMTTETKGSAYDQAVVLHWWRKRRAEVEGVPFNEPFPESPAEVVLNRFAASHGVE